MNNREAPSVAFIGTGRMGSAMVMRLLSAGRRVTVWNRTVDKVLPLVAAGACAAQSPGEAASSARVLVTMLTDASSVAEVLFDMGVAEALRPDSIAIDMSSIAPGSAREQSVRLKQRRIHHLDAPVSGGTKGAADGTLAIMVGGEFDVFNDARALLEILGRPTWVGASGCGQLAKLANQAIVAVTIGAVAEALLLAVSGGADATRVREALSGGFADSAILRQHGVRMLERSWLPGGSLRLQVKDLTNILAAASELGLQLPLCAEASRIFECALEHGLGDHDHSAVLLELERRNPGHRVGREPDRQP